MMSDSTPMDAASKRLASALDALDAALDRRRDADRERDGMAAQLHALGNDRARLAGDLDALTARARRLEQTNREVGERIESAMGQIRMVVDAETP